ncbi:intradiol ring-cleavage dioxygenase [Actinoplanes sichuanensis]|uniref:3,4-dioxygenase subunit beta n=1 Tax=Actinoplanes sichuanensis TaxID=512349 RepID=A0ABW4AR06_9ACTN|nr:3,4-dioxygenase subunit beta [Actinoplanes sichuanensis]BEL06577.1 intradiol ring-cleavage dioxygenase [Actinoplanes sichuanensis]
MHRQPKPTYQGRPLPRPDEELTDQGLGFDLGTLLGRRQLLRAFGAGAATLGIAACSEPSPARPGTPAPNRSTGGPTVAGSAPPAEIPEETQGPFPGDGSNGPDILERSGVVRKDIRSSLGGSTLSPGVPLDLELTLTGVSGAAVYIWQCDSNGRYSMYGDGVTQETFLRGVQITDDTGRVGFTTVFPGCYPGRWPHIHFEVYPDQASITDHRTVLVTSQLAFPQEVCEKVYRLSEYGRSATHLADISLDTDMVFRDDHAARQTVTVSGDVTTGYRATLAVPVNA